MWQQNGRGPLIHTIMLFIIIDSSRSNPSGFIGTKLPLWTWECVNDRCLPTQVTGALRIQSLETCNMLCASMQLWPQPTGPVSLSTTAVPVRADLFQLQVMYAPSKAVHEYLNEAFRLFRDDLHYIEKNAAGFAEWRNVFVTIAVNGSGDPRMKINTDESYTIEIRPQSIMNGPLVAKITANSFCGARHGLETLHQLIWFDPYSGTLFMLEAARVEDSPHFPYRGLLLDTARNFFPLRDLIRTIDAMAACKLNTFHWHISDSQAFPLKLASVPQLAVYGAYGTGAVYSTEDVRKLVHRARLRGIRVLIEVNTPAHVGGAWAWGPSIGFGDLVHCFNPDDWMKYCSEPPCGQLNPKNPHVYNILEAIYAEIIHLTGVDDIFHIGGDDYSPNCFREHYRNRDPESTLQEFTYKALERLENINGRLPNLTILWMSPLSDNLKTDLRHYVGYLGLQNKIPDIPGMGMKFIGGIRTILSQSDPWDLNSGMGDWFENANGMPYNSWQRVYEHRPWARQGLTSVIGGEVTAWASTLSVGGLDARLWPRAAAFAERVWSDRPEGATRPVHVRLDVHRSRLVARGIRATPIWSLWCTQYTYTCG